MFGNIIISFGTAKLAMQFVHLVSHAGTCQWWYYIDKLENSKTGKMINWKIGIVNM